MPENLGYTQPASAGIENAMARATKEGPLDLLLTDTALPGMTGADLGARLPRQRVASA